MKKKKKIFRVFMSLFACFALSGVSLITLSSCGDIHGHESESLHSSSDSISSHTSDQTSSNEISSIISDETSHVEEHEHVWDEGTITKKASCTEDGEMTYSCTFKNCPATRIALIPKKPHEWDEGTITKEAICSQEGEKVYTCINCNTTRTEKIAKTEHDYDDNNECRICHNIISYSFSANTLTKGIYIDVLPIENTVYTIHANASKDVWVENKSASFDNGSKIFTKAIKLNGKANLTGEFAISRVIEMTFKKAGNITVYVGKGGTNKHLGLYNDKFTSILQKEISSTDSKYTFSIPSAGTYYIGGDIDMGSVYIYGIDFK